MGSFQYYVGGFFYMDNRFPFPLSLQLTLPENYPSNSDFSEAMTALKKYSFVGVELNIIEPANIDTGELKSYLQSYNLRLTMFATGGTAKVSGLSLADEFEEKRALAIEKCLGFIDFAKKFEAGIIIGFLKGGTAAHKSRARRLFSESLESIAPHAEACRVPVLVEATNRYESSVANGLDDTVELLADIQSRYLRILPDTFHMNIEESNMFTVLEKYGQYYDSIHFSDNNRYFPGRGAIDFVRIIFFLKEINYRGGVGIEGNIKTDLTADIHATMEYLISL
jgi:sugar phosphate isomerase/epimerase